MLNVTHLGQKSREFVDQNSIASCWLECEILSISSQFYISEESSHFDKETKTKEVNEIVNVFPQLLFKGREMVIESSDTRGTQAEKAINKWLKVKKEK